MLSALKTPFFLIFRNTSPKEVISKLAVKGWGGKKQKKNKFVRYRKKNSRQQWEGPRSKGKYGAFKELKKSLVSKICKNNSLHPTPPFLTGCQSPNFFWYSLCYLIRKYIVQLEKVNHNCCKPVVIILFPWSRRHEETPGKGFPL